jgi:hypothetical protein
VTVCQKKKAMTPMMMTHSAPMIRSIPVFVAAFHSTAWRDRKALAAASCRADVRK